ncbi:hypothetical protein BGX26_005262 [Mortierella sp. AD094]|nr:hypothetical protein BGX26_005262 [Mortierella sp. AD094]
MPIMPSNWSILQVIPQTLQATYETDQLLVFTDDACVTPSRYTRAQILPMAIVTTYYRYGVPLSFKWSRYSTLLPNTSTTTSSSTSSTTVKELPTATYRPNFQTAILPPKPSSWWNKPCDDGQNSTTCTTTKNNNSTRDIVIVGVTVSILAVGFLTAGAFYIYRTFYTSPDSNGSDNVISSDAIFKSNTRSNTSTLNGVNPNTDTDTDPSRFNSSYVYNHDEDENTRPKFMFDHRHDNINTNRNPKLFKENPSSSRAQNNNPSIHIPLQPRSSGSGQMSPSSELSLLVRTKK